MRTSPPIGGVAAIAQRARHRRRSGDVGAHLATAASNHAQAASPIRHQRRSYGMRIIHATSTNRPAPTSAASPSQPWRGGTYSSWWRHQRQVPDTGPTNSHRCAYRSRQFPRQHNTVDAEGLAAGEVPLADGVVRHRAPLAHTPRPRRVPVADQRVAEHPAELPVAGGHRRRHVAAGEHPLSVALLVRPSRAARSAPSATPNGGRWKRNGR
eukprot:gene3517-biopygen4862